MGVSTDGQLTYGIPLEEDATPPWDTEEFNHDIEKWWLSETGYKPKWNLYTEDGNDYAPDYTDEKREEVRALRDKHLEDNPIPIGELRHCSGDYPMFIISVPGLSFQCWRGSTEEISPTRMLNMVKPEHTETIINFVEKYELQVEKHKGNYRGIGWYLTSYWG